jgi:hypothetical protein
MKTSIKGLVNCALLGAIGLVTLAAHADTASTFFTMEYIEAGKAPEDGIAIRPLSFNVPNPKGCPDTGGYIFANPVRTAAEKATMDKLITGAFLAGKQISVIVDSTRCSVGTTTGAPVYNYVTLHYNQ